MKWPLSKLYKITPPPRLHLISRDKPDSLSSRRSLLVAALSYITYIKSAFPLIRLAIRSTPSPVWEKAFIVVRYLRNLTVLPSANSDLCVQLCPRGMLIADRRRACAARPKGKNEKLPGGSLLLSRQLKFFPATGAGRQVARATPCFHPIDFHITTQPSLVLSWAPRKYRLPSSPPVFPAYAISSISYSRVPMPSFSPCSRPACQLVSGNSAVK